MTLSSLAKEAIYFIDLLSPSMHKFTNASICNESVRNMEVELHVSIVGFCIVSSGEFHVFGNAGQAIDYKICSFQGYRIILETRIEIEFFFQPSNL